MNSRHIKSSFLVYILEAVLHHTPQSLTWGVWLTTDSVSTPLPKMNDSWQSERNLDILDDAKLSYVGTTTMLVFEIPDMIVHSRRIFCTANIDSSPGQSQFSMCVTLKNWDWPGDVATANSLSGQMLCPLSGEYRLENHTMMYDKVSRCHGVCPYILWRLSISQKVCYWRFYCIHAIWNWLLQKKWITPWSLLQDNRLVIYHPDLGDAVVLPSLPPHPPICQNHHHHHPADQSSHDGRPLCLAGNVLELFHLHNHHWHHLLLSMMYRISNRQS